MTAWPPLLALGVNPPAPPTLCVACLGLLGDTITSFYPHHPFLKPPEGDSVLSSAPLRLPLLKELPKPVAPKRLHVKLRQIVWMCRI